MARIFVRRVCTAWTVPVHRARVYPCGVSTRFRVTEVPGDPPLVRKRGDADAIAREVAALAILDGRPWAPALVDHGPGWMLSTRLPGAPRPIGAVGASEAQRLGALVRELHEVRREPIGGLWSWSAPAATLGDYRRRRGEDTERMLAGLPDAGIARHALAGAAEEPHDAAPFRLLHGDLVEANVVWGPDGPGLVDWEFSRMGDPAEDLAYLIEANALPEAVAASVLEGYALPGMAGQVDEWRVLVAADAGAWYLAEGMAEEGERLLARARGLITPGPHPPGGPAR